MSALVRSIPRMQVDRPIRKERLPISNSILGEAREDLPHRISLARESAKLDLTLKLGLHHQTQIENIKRDHEVAEVGSECAGRH